MGFLEAIGSIKGKKGVFTIVLVASILIIFEICLFYFIIVPDIEREMDESIHLVGSKIAESINEKNRNMQQQNVLFDVAVAQTTQLVFNEKVDNALSTLADREKLLTNHINRYTIYTGVVIMLILIITLAFVWSSIANDENIKQGIEDANMTDATLTAMLTVSILIGFQVLFYFYGRQFNYPGALGNEELLWVILDSINLTNKQITQQEAISH
jgi:hypothetical protein